MNKAIVDRIEFLKSRNARIPAHVSAPVATGNLWQGECSCGQTQPQATPLAATDKWMRTHSKEA